MLKIRDDIDLKELEKYEFEPRYSETTGKIVRYVKEDKRNIVRYIDNDYNHNPYWEVLLQDSELLYDLIKADLIEKVDD